MLAPPTPCQGSAARPETGSPPVLRTGSRPQAATERRSLTGGFHAALPFGANFNKHSRANRLPQKLWKTARWRSSKTGAAPARERPGEEAGEVGGHRNRLTHPAPVLRDPVAVPWKCQCASAMCSTWETEDRQPQLIRWSVLIGGCQHRQRAQTLQTIIH